MRYVLIFLFFLSKPVFSENFLPLDYSKGAKDMTELLTSTTPVCSFVGSTSEACIGQWQSMDTAVIFDGTTPITQSFAYVTTPLSQIPAQYRNLTAKDIRNNFNEIKLPLLEGFTDGDVTKRYYRLGEGPDAPVAVVTRDGKVSYTRMSAIERSALVFEDGEYKVDSDRTGTVYALDIDFDGTSKERCAKLPDEKQKSTEAGFCEECEKEKDMRKNLRNWFKITSGALKKLDNQGKQRIRNKIGYHELCTADGRGKDPNEIVKKYVKNFNRTCKAGYDDFDEFFKEAACEACRQGIPPEVMMAMMTIESSGNCKAKGDGGRSHGIFQVYDKYHTCSADLPKRRKDFSSLGACLAYPPNNLHKAISIFAKGYNSTNKNALTKENCKPWGELSSKEQDGFKRGLSAYNGGAGRMDSLERRTGMGKDIRDLSWEGIRVAFTNLPNYDDDMTYHNVAHVDAALGRSVPGFPGSFVDAWTNSNYLIQFYKNKGSCKERDI